MQRAIELADQGKYQVSPNPRVGAVIVHEGKIIGEGYHQKYGEAHAEVMAIASVTDKSLLAKSCLYVNLEPCSHHGKTPPCANLILNHAIPQVIISNADPFKEVSGNGIRRLQENGVKVSLGMLEAAGEELNKRFFTFHRKKRPYVILKWAQTQDGFIGRAEDDPNQADNWISNAVSKQLVHLWRAEEDAILVGKNTVMKDNPALTCREVEGGNPIRIIIDANAELDSGFKVFDEQAETLVLTDRKEEKIQKVSWHQKNLQEQMPQSVMEVCYQRNIHSLIVEGGANVLEQFLEANLWDEARVFHAQKTFGKGVKAPLLNQQEELLQKVDSDELRIYRNRNR